MKVNKVTILVCAAIAVASALAMTIAGDARVQNVLSGIFTGFIVSLVISTIGYFHERECIVDKIKNNIVGLYLDLLVIKRIVGNTLPLTQNASSMNQLQFDTISSMSEILADYIKQMNLGMFSPMIQQERMAKIVKGLEKYVGVAYAVKNNANDLQNIALRFDISVSELETIRLRGSVPTQEQIQEPNNLRHQIVVKTAKYHEFVSNQIIELDQIAALCFPTKKKDGSWDTVKVDLEKQADDIVKVDGSFL